jgi:hypothetical protein
MSAPGHAPMGDGDERELAILDAGGICGDNGCTRERGHSGGHDASSLRSSFAFHHGFDRGRLATRDCCPKVRR